MKDYFFYEHIAARLTGIKPEALFARSKQGLIPFARMMCCVYRSMTLKMTNFESTARYGLDHSTINNAKKRINEYQQTRDSRYGIWLEFLKQCKQEMYSVNDKQPDYLFAAMLNDRISQVGFEQYKVECTRIFEQLCYCLNNPECEEQFMKSMLEKASEKIVELKHLWE